MRRGKATEHNSGFEFSGHLQELITLWCAAKSICRLFFADFGGSLVLAAPSVNCPPAMSASTTLSF